MYERLVGDAAGKIEGWVERKALGQYWRREVVVWKAVLAVVVERVGLSG